MDDDSVGRDDYFCIFFKASEPPLLLLELRGLGCVLVKIWMSPLLSWCAATILTMVRDISVKGNAAEKESMQC
jgi:hypothetical protein